MIKRIFDEILSRVVLIGILFMIFMTISIFWTEYQRSRQTNLRQRVSPDTHWVMQKFSVYFILGNKFGRINIDGSDLRYLYKASFLIQEFIFSPDGKFIVLVSSGDILLYDVVNDQINLIQSLGSLIKENAANGLIRGIQWSPDSKKFCYEVYRWSDVASQDHFYIYYVDSGKNSLLRMPPWPLRGVVWDRDTQFLFGYKTHRRELSVSPDFLGEIYALSLGDSPAKLVRVIKTPNENLTFADFQSAGINPFVNQNFSNRVGQRNVLWKSPHGNESLGLDKNRFLYFQDALGKRKQLFSFKQDEMSVRHLRWVPENKYVMLTHSSLGILVLDPNSGRIGQLVSAQAFGWYEDQ